MVSQSKVGCLGGSCKLVSWLVQGRECNVQGASWCKVQGALQGASKCKVEVQGQHEEEEELDRSAPVCIVRVQFPCGEIMSGV